MLAWGIAVAMMGGTIGVATGDVDRIGTPGGTADVATEKVGPPVPMRPGVRPVLIAGFERIAVAAARSASPRAQWQVGGLTLSLRGSGRGGSGRRSGAADAASPITRTGRWRPVQAMAARADWTVGGGSVRLMAGSERIRRVDTGLGRGGPGVRIATVAVAYRDGSGWSLGGGWRAVEPTGTGAADGRIRGLAGGVPPAAAGPFVHATLPLGGGASVRIAGAAARLDAGYAKLLGQAMDRRAIVTVRQPFF